MLMKAIGIGQGALVLTEKPLLERYGEPHHK